MGALRRLGVEVDRRVPVLIAANPFSAGYLEVKRRRMQHELPGNGSGSPTNGNSEPPASGRLTPGLTGS
jgi:GTP cyclohydrolase II